MKKILSIVLALVLVFSMAACGSDQGKGETKGTETKNTEATKAPETDAPETETKAPETKTTEAEETKAPETEETAMSGETNGETAGESEASQGGVGTWDGSTYTSTEMGISFKMPEGWTKVSDVTSAGSTTTQEFMLMNGSTGESFILMTEDLAASGIDSMTETDYLGVLKEQLTQQNQGYTIEETLAEVDLAGTSYTVLAASLEQNNTVAQQLYVARKIEGKMYIFIITAPEGNSTGVDAIMDSFVAA